MSKGIKIPENVREEIRKSYLMGLSIKEIAWLHKISEMSVKRIVSDIINRRYKSDAMVHSFSLDSIIETGYATNDIGEVATIEGVVEGLTNRERLNEGQGKMVKCPECDRKFRAFRLLLHLIKEHKRYDLEYLLNDYNNFEVI